MSLFKKSIMCLALALVCGGLVVTSTALAQDWKGQGRLAGVVEDAEGNPVPGAVVQLELPGRGKPDPLTTDKKGRWAILGISGGRWNVDIGAEGYVTRNLFANVRQGRHMPPMKTTLEVAAPAGPPPEVMEALEKGDAAYKEGRYADARVEYVNLLDLRPDLGTTLLMQIAHCYKQEGNREKELEYLGQVLEADPTNSQVRTLMALEAMEGGMVERGMELLAEVEDASVTDPNVFYNIGVTFLNSSRPDEAIIYFTKAVSLAPDYVDGYYQRALTYFGAQKYAECRADFEKVLELSPEGPQADTAKQVLGQLPAQAEAPEQE